jgi:putative tryptophan/tyrosine transport system substrate-binding protein
LTGDPVGSHTQAQMVGRRRFVQITAAVVVSPVAVQAQKKSLALGFLTPGAVPSAAETAKDPLRAGLRELGWEEGRTLHIEARFAEGREERLPELAAALVRKKVDVIVAAGPNATRAARQATDSIPIVAIGANPVELGLARSLARPGGNVTGLAFVTGPEILSKRLELLKRVVPSARRIAYIRGSPVAGRPLWQAETLAAARTLDITLSAVLVDNDEDLDRAFAELARNRPDAMCWSSSAANNRHAARIVDFAARERLPAIYSLRLAGYSEGLMSYGADFSYVVRRAALYVDKIFNGAKPGELPIEQPTRFQFVINLKAANALGLTIPQELLLQADEVIR